MSGTFDWARNDLQETLNDALNTAALNMLASEGIDGYTNPDVDQREAIGWGLRFQKHLLDKALDLFEAGARAEGEKP